MKYVKAKVILPDYLIQEIQKYVDGEMVYIPKLVGTRKRWGECSGSRSLLSQRNNEIRKDYKSGIKPAELSKKYYLSFDSIKKIIYSG